MDWSKPSREILNRVRGFQPWPGCYGFRQGHRLHIWKAGPPTATEKAMALAPGELRAIGRRLFVGCGSGNDLIELLEVQSEGKKRMPAAAYLNGNTIEANETLT